MSYSLVSHRIPVVRLAQVHVYPLVPALHVPPFRQGNVKHTSARTIQFPFLFWILYRNSVSILHKYYAWVSKEMRSNYIIVYSKIYVFHIESQWTGLCRCMCIHSFQGGTSLHSGKGNSHTRHLQEQHIVSSTIQSSFSQFSSLSDF